MGRKCLVCSNPERKKIDKQITDNVAYRRISSHFGITDKAVGSHAKNHLKPKIQKAVAEIDAQVKLEVIETARANEKYRDEILLAPVEKARMMQSRLLDLFDTSTEVLEQISAAREFRGFLSEEAKLSGHYQKDRENSETLEKVINAFNMWLKDNPSASEQDKQLWVGRFAERGGVELSALASRVGVAVQEVSQVQ